MVDIPPTAATQPAPQATPPATNVTPVETTVSDVPDKIQQLARQIQVNATVSQVPGDGTITLNSTIGSLTLLLPTIIDAKQQQLTQQLIDLLQSQKPVTVVVQPGTPPTQAFLLLPPPASSVSNTPTATNIAQTNVLLQTLPPQQPQPVTVGASFTAIVLPRDIVIASNPLSQAPYAAPSIPTQPAGTQAPAAPPTPAAVAQLQTPPALSPFANPETAVPNVTEEAVLLATLKAEQTIAQTEQQILPNPLAPQTSAPAISQPALPNTPIPPALTPPNPSSVSPALSTLLQPGTEVTIQINAVYVPPATTGSTISGIPLPSPYLPNIPQLPTPGPNQIVATVTGTGTNGQLILKAGDATLYVKQSADLPVGSSVLITVSQAKPVLPVTLPTDIQSFTSLQQAVAALAQIDPQLAQMVIQNHIPQPTAALPGALLFLMSAFKQGNVRTWLGEDAVNALARAGKFELLGKLTDELNNAGQAARDNVVGEWRAYPVPLYNNNQLQMLNLYVHQQGERQTGQHPLGAAARNNVRFLIDVRMSRLGALQLDGFVQPRKLDMMIRSEQLLPEGLHQELRSVYTRALGAVDYAGSLNFQVGRHHWLNLQKPAQPASMTT